MNSIFMNTCLLTLNNYDDNSMMLLMMVVVALALAPGLANVYCSKFLLTIVRVLVALPLTQLLSKIFQ